jgi:hypothetical protein
MAEVGEVMGEVSGEVFGEHLTWLRVPTHRGLSYVKVGGEVFSRKTSFFIEKGHLAMLKSLYSRAI